MYLHFRMRRTRMYTEVRLLKVEKPPFYFFEGCGTIVSADQIFV